MPSSLLLALLAGLIASCQGIRIEQNGDVHQRPEGSNPIARSVESNTAFRSSSSEILDAIAQLDADFDQFLANQMPSTLEIIPEVPSDPPSEYSEEDLFAVLESVIKDAPSGSFDWAGLGTANPDLVNQCQAMFDRVVPMRDLPQSGPKNIVSADAGKTEASPSTSTLLNILSSSEFEFSSDFNEMLWRDVSSRYPESSSRPDIGAGTSVSGSKRKNERPQATCEKRAKPNPVGNTPSATNKSPFSPLNTAGVSCGDHQDSGAESIYASKPDFFQSYFQVQSDADLASKFEKFLDIHFSKDLFHSEHDVLTLGAPPGQSSANVGMLASKQESCPVSSGSNVGAVRRAATAPFSGSTRRLQTNI